MEYQREGDGGVLVFGVGKEKVDSDGVVSLAVGEGYLVIDGLVVLVHAYSGQSSSMGGTAVLVGKVHLFNLIDAIFTGNFGNIGDDHVLAESDVGIVGVEFNVEYHG